MQTVKTIIEQHEDGYTGYPLGFTNGAIVGQGKTYREAFEDTQSAIRFFIDYYGEENFLSHFKQRRKIHQLNNHHE